MKKQVVSTVGKVTKIKPEIETPDDVTRRYLLLSVVVAIAVWDVAFNYGAHKVIFFEKFFLVWIVSVGILLADLALKNRRLLRGWALVAMLAPTAVLGLTVWANNIDRNVSGFNAAFFIVSTLITILFLPYAAYVILSVTHADMIKIKSKRLLGWLIAIAVIVGALGISIGHFNRLFLTCDSFTVSGNDTPENCSQEDRSLDARF